MSETATPGRMGLAWPVARSILLSKISEFDSIIMSQQNGGIGENMKESQEILIWASVAIILLFVGGALEPYNRVANISAAILLFISVMVCAVALVAADRSERGEFQFRLSEISRAFETSAELSADGSSEATVSGDTALRQPLALGSPIVSIIPVFRGGIWERIPVLLLVEGDLIALADGDLAPGKCEICLENSSKRIPPIYLEKGDVARLPQPRSSGLDAFMSLAPDSEVFLELCGDMRCYRLLETPIEAFLARTRSVRPSPLSDAHRRTYTTASSKARLALVVVVFLAGAVRIAIVGHEARHWSTYLVINPATAIVCSMFPMLPVLISLVEVFSTSRILMVVEAGTASSRNIKRQGALRAFLRVASQRLNLSQWHGLEAWASKEAGYSVPLRAVRLVERLGAATMFCVVDDDVIFEPFSTAEEVFFNNEATILDLYSKGSSKVGFESPTWWQSMASLKPLGLCSLVTADKPVDPFHVPSQSIAKSRGHSGGGAEKDYTGCRNAMTALIGHLQRRPPMETHLAHLANEIGFLPEDLDVFRERLRVHVLALPTAVGVHTQSQSQEEMWRRGALHPQLQTVVVEDRRSSALQLLSKGLPARVLEACVDTWDGGIISPLSPEDRKAILAQCQKWCLEDLDVVAFAYSPVPHAAESLLQARDDDPLVLFLVDSKKNRTETSNSHQDVSSFAAKPWQKKKRGFLGPRAEDVSSAIGSLLNQQVFLGMVASRIPLKPHVEKTIEDTMEAGVRFVFFSPRNMRRSKALAEKMGFETDWNCAISLRELEDDADVPRWSVNAQMPYGIKAIRSHIDEIDNVPLLVSMFTDSTPETINEMFKVFQENGETVLAVGISYRASNALLFESADVSIALSGLPGGQDPCSLPATSRTTLSLADIRFNERIVSLSCALTLSRECSLTQVMEIVRESRRLLINVYQVISFLVLVATTISVLILVQVCAPILSISCLSSLDLMLVHYTSLFCVALPMLASDALPSVLTQTPCKNDQTETAPADFSRFVWLLFAKAVPTACVCLVIQFWTFGSFLTHALHEESDGGIYSCKPSKGRMQWFDFLWCSSLESGGRRNRTVQSAHGASQALVVFTLVVSLCAQSSGYLYRTKSILVKSPLSNTTWLLCTICMVLFHLMILFVSIESSTGTHDISWLPWQLWIVVFLWPFVALTLGEKIKSYDAWHYDRFMKFLQLEFDTRLGMYSPR